MRNIGNKNTQKHSIQRLTALPLLLSIQMPVYPDIPDIVPLPDAVHLLPLLVFQEDLHLQKSQFSLCLYKYLHHVCPATATHFPSINKLRLPSILNKSFHITKQSNTLTYLFSLYLHTLHIFVHHLYLIVQCMKSSAVTFLGCQI